MNFKLPYHPSDTNPKSVSSTYYKVTVNKNLWKTVSKQVRDKSYYLIEGEPKASVTSKGAPFISVSCSTIKVVNGLLEEREGSSDSLVLSGDLPEVIAVHEINVPENLGKANTALQKALQFFQKYHTFRNPIKVKKETMTLVAGYAEYLLAKDLGMPKVPVTYNLFPTPPSKDEYKISRIAWFDPKEVTQVPVRDIVLTEDIHLNVQNFTFSINLKQIRETGTINIPVAIRPLEDGKYSLVTGAARYFAAKILDKA